MIQHEYSQLEEKVKDLIRKSLNPHIAGHDNIDNMRPLQNSSNKLLDNRRQSLPLIHETRKDLPAEFLRPPNATPQGKIRVFSPR